MPLLLIATAWMSYFAHGQGQRKGCPLQLNISPFDKCLSLSHFHPSLCRKTGKGLGRSITRYNGRFNVQSLQSHNYSVTWCIPPLPPVTTLGWIHLAGDNHTRPYNICPIKKSCILWVRPCFWLLAVSVNSWMEALFPRECLVLGIAGTSRWGICTCSPAGALNPPWVNPGQRL